MSKVYAKAVVMKGDEFFKGLEVISPKLIQVGEMDIPQITGPQIVSRVKE